MLIFEEEIWQEFCDNPDRLAFESERLIAQLSQKSIEESLNIGIDNLPQGLEREAVVKQRVSQSFFSFCRNECLQSSLLHLGNYTSFFVGGVPYCRLV